MSTRNWRVMMLSGLVALGLAACGGDTDGDKTPAAETTTDGVNKGLPDGKADAWNWLNNPSRFRTDLKYNFEELPHEGNIAHQAWTATYWPMYEDGINARWQGVDVLSPAEKYDKAFNGWEASEEFMKLKPYNPSTCEWDDEYYKQLGPAATYSAETRGNARSRNGKDDDGDGVSDRDECQSGDSKKYDRDGVETWWGLCHAWAPAAILEDEPLSAVTRNGVTFDVSDLKALLIQQYDRTSAYMIGARCNDLGEEIERDETGRIKDADCRDINPGAWHVVITNFIGINRKGLVTERTYDYEVWNQPVVGYKLTEHREVSLQEAHRLLRVEDGMEGTGEFVHDVEEGSPEADAILTFVNQATLAQLDDDAGLDSRAAKNIIEHRNTSGEFKTLKELEAISYVASKAFGQLLKYSLENGYTSLTYKYNRDATRFVEVRMTLDWLTEANPSKERTDTEIDYYTRQDYYHYVLEMDDNGTIIGGEWIGSSITNHPDFIWLPTRAVRGNPSISTDTVREMIAESRANVLGEPNVGGEEKTYALDAGVAIPDNDPKGAEATVNITDEGVVKSLKIDLDIDHTYRGDLFVELRHGGGIVTVFDGRNVDNRWDDDVVITAQDLPEFKGSKLSGDWTLRVVDMAGSDVGAVQSMKLTFTVE